MQYKELTKDEARQCFQLIKEKGIEESYYDSLDSEYKKIRKDILSFVPKENKKAYDFDLELAVNLYEYFNSKNFVGFNEAVASNYGFWRYICLKVVPDVIIKRHGLKEEYFFEKNVRMYIPTLWWYIEISYQGNMKDTIECLKPLSTDFILQFVERPGRDGMYIDVTRTIFKYLPRLPKNIIKDKSGNQSLMRKIVIQNTAKTPNFNLVVEGKVDEYVKELFRSCGVNL